MEFWVQLWRNEPADFRFLDISCTVALRRIPPVRDWRRSPSSFLLHFAQRRPGRQGRKAGEYEFQSAGKGVSSPPEVPVKVPFKGLLLYQPEQGPTGPQVKAVPTDLLAGLRAHCAWRLIHVLYYCLWFSPPVYPSSCDQPESLGQLCITPTGPAPVSQSLDSSIFHAPGSTSKPLFHNILKIGYFTNMPSPGLLMSGLGVL